VAIKATAHTNDTILREFVLKEFMAHSIFSFLLPGEVDFGPQSYQDALRSQALIGTHASGVLHHGAMAALIDGNRPEACRRCSSLHSVSGGTGFAA
jgi:hypothetical protein